MRALALQRPCVVIHIHALALGIGVAHELAIGKRGQRHAGAHAVVLALRRELLFLFLGLGLFAPRLLGFLGGLAGLQFTVHAAAIGRRRGARWRGARGRRRHRGPHIAGPLQDAVGRHLIGRRQVAEYFAPLCVQPLPLRKGIDGNEAAGAQQDKRGNLHGGSRWGQEVENGQALALESSHFAPALPRPTARRPGKTRPAL